MAMGKRKRNRQPTMWVTTTDLPTAESHPFYARLNQLLREHGFDDFAEAQCAMFYADTMGRPGLPPGIYFRLLLIGYFEGIDSERGIAWTWRAPLGYVNGRPRDGEPSLRPDPDRAAYVRQAFELVASGQYTVNSALRIVTAAGLRTRSGKPLTPQTFGALLKNPICAGWLTAASLGLNRVRGDFEAIVPDLLSSSACRGH
jgi:hypothetical protein